MSRKTTRRRFLKTSAALGAGYWIADRAAAASHSPNERVAFACIGTEGKGHERFGRRRAAGRCRGDLRRRRRVPRRRHAALPQGQGVRRLPQDVRRDAQEHRCRDRQRAGPYPRAAAAMAMRHGIHCFVQKPLTHSLYEARTLAKLAREKKLATQMGNQGSAESGLRKAAASAAGVLGAVSEVHISTDRPIWPQGIDRPAPPPPPKNLDWDLWLGPAPARPYGELTDEQRGKYPETPYHPFAWRGWWDFGTGALGDMACHLINMAFHGLDLRNPETIEAETSGHNRDSLPEWSIITYEFPATVARPAVKLFWYDGGKLPNRELFQGFRGRRGDCLVIGTKGKMIFGLGSGYQLTPGLTEPEVTFPVSPGHFEEFVRAIRGGEPAVVELPRLRRPAHRDRAGRQPGRLGCGQAGQGTEDPMGRGESAGEEPRGDGDLIRREYRAGYDL